MYYDLDKVGFGVNPFHKFIGKLIRELIESSYVKVDSWLSKRIRRYINIYLLLVLLPVHLLNTIELLFFYLS